MLGFLRRKRIYLVAAHCSTDKHGQTLETGTLVTNSRGIKLLKEVEKGLAARIRERHTEDFNNNEVVNVHVFTINPLD